MVSLQTAAGLGVTVIGLGWAVGGYLPHPWIGLVIIFVGIVILVWPILTRVTGIDPFRPARVRLMARLLREAAAEERKIQRKRAIKKGAESAEETASWAWLWLRIAEFLDRGFVHQVGEDCENYRKSQEKKLGNKFCPHKSRADFLERLADRLKSSDLDPGFVMPEDFSQFDHTTWPANVEK